MAGTVTADPLGVLVAFGAGILSFLSPCVLPLVPGYLSMVSGLSALELGARSSGTGVTDASPRRPVWPLVRSILLFVSGFTLVFVVLGAAASSLGGALTAHKASLITVAGVVVVVLGVLMIVSSLPAGVWARLGPSVSGRAAWLVGERRFHFSPERLGAWGAPVMGMAFAFAWTPCIGPVLGAVLTLAASRPTLGGGVLLLFAYSLGLGVPFLATGVAFDRLTGIYGRLRGRLAIVQVAAAFVLVAFGAILLSGDLGWLSAQFSHALSHLGLERLTTS